MMPALSTGRVRVERGSQVVTLTLAQWALKGSATLTLSEAQNLIADLHVAIATSDVQPQRSALPDIL